jgi:hypothetical protein
MATERLPMRKIREILRQKWVLGYVFTCPAALGHYIRGQSRTNLKEEK